MQVLLISLAMGVFLHDAIREGLGGTQGTSSLGVGWGWDWRWVVGGAAVGKMLLGVWYWWVCRRALKALADEPGRTMRRLGRRTLLAHLLIGSLYVGDLVAGLLVVIRERVVSTISVDELLVMGPTLGLIVWLWWAYYPVERRLREAGVFERVEAGEPVYPVPTRGGYVVAQCRHVLMLLFVPLVLILGWVEVVHRMQARGWVSEMWVGPATAGGAGVVFVLAPLMIRHLWDTIPLPEGPTRRRLVELCEMHAVRVRELLLWRTYAAGGVLNAGVMGVVGRLRYIMLSDALLEMLTPEQVEAVMAHELAHAKRRHMLWLPLAAIGSLGLLELSLGTLTAAASASLPAGWAVFPPGSLWGGGWLAAAAVDAAGLPETGLLLGTALAVAAWLPLFGWVSRRIERQADAFAAQHLTRRFHVEHPHEPLLARDAGPGTILPQASGTMIAALQRVAELNHISVDRPSWRHGSIAWRQAYLRSIVGQPVDRLPIDRDMRWVQALSILAVAGVAGLTMYG